MEPTLLIIGGGLAGLSTGCYARMNGWRTVLLEHSLALGGLCTAWHRGPYTIDGCIHWLMGASPGGMLREVYEELGIVPEVPLHTLDRFERYEHPHGWAVDITANLAALERDLRALAPEDAEAVAELFTGIDALGELTLPRDAREVQSIGERLRWLWDNRGAIAPLIKFRGSVGEWTAQLNSPALRDLFRNLLFPDMPMLFAVMLLSQLGRGHITRPVGGSARVRDAVVDRYRRLGGEVHTSATVDEILVRHRRAVGVRLADGRQLRGDAIVSTASAHETALRLLGGRYGDRRLRERLERWPMFEPILLASFGVSIPLADEPPALILRQARPLSLGGSPVDALYLRIYNDEASVAPPGHTVVQTLVPTSWDYWADSGDRYQDRKQHAAEELLARIGRRLPAVPAAIDMIDVSTPLSFWRYARSWKGAFEGWLPTTRTTRARVAKTITGLGRLYLAGQWVEPGGGVPTALLSGRKVVQILCADARRTFITRTPIPAPAEVPPPAPPGPRVVRP